MWLIRLIISLICLTAAFSLSASFLRPYFPCKAPVIKWIARPNNLMPWPLKWDSSEEFHYVFVRILVKNVDSCSLVSLNDKWLINTYKWNEAIITSFNMNYMLSEKPPTYNILCRKYFLVVSCGQLNLIFSPLEVENALSLNINVWVVVIP